MIGIWRCGLYEFHIDNEFIKWRTGNNLYDGISFFFYIEVIQLSTY